MNIPKTISFKWPGAKYQLKDGRAQVLEFTQWEHPTKTSAPTRAEIQAADAERIAAETPAPIDRAARKKAKEDVLDFLKVPPGQRQEVARALRFLAEDGNVD